MLLLSSIALNMSSCTHVSAVSVLWNFLSGASLSTELKHQYIFVSQVGMGPRLHDLFGESWINLEISSIGAGSKFERHTLVFHWESIWSVGSGGVHIDFFSCPQISRILDMKKYSNFSINSANEVWEGSWGPLFTVRTLFKIVNNSFWFPEASLI